MAQERYVDAIYDFYFVLESLFSNGHTKNRKVKGQFRQSNILQTAVGKGLASGLVQKVLARDERLKQEFAVRYLKKAHNEITDSFVELRGFLHHHSVMRPNVWHPEEHHRFKLDALVLSSVCFNVLSELTFPLLYCEDSARQYQHAASLHL
ncbi:MAG TPA: hypothetical protein VN277_08410, partial [Acidiferrobacterales bacterium]|nr:hypothetical protein [Acidiferrobacterales bacterium]